MKSKLSRAIVIAATNHDGQFDKGGNPYILHPLKVMHYLDTDEIEVKIIAVLHDVVEDTDVTFQQLIDEGFCDRIIIALRLLTKQVGQSQEEYECGILSNVDAMLVKAADLRHNSDIRRLKGVTEKDLRRVEKYHKFYLKIKEKLIEYGIRV